MITPPRTTIPIPDAVADLSASQLPPHIRQAITDAGDAGRLLTATGGPQYAEARQLLHQRLAYANKRLAAHNPHRMYGWGNLPSLNRKEQ